MMGRTLHVRRAAAGVACFDYKELCDTDVGAADYSALCSAFHTVILTGIPVMTTEVSKLHSLSSAYYV
jgi:cell division protein ZapE